MRDWVTVALLGRRVAGGDPLPYRTGVAPRLGLTARVELEVAEADTAQALRSGDVVATTDGLVAYTGIRLGAEQTAEFTPVASYPGLTASVRARLGEMKVAPVSAAAFVTVPAPTVM